MQSQTSNSIIEENLVFGNITLIATTDGPDNRFISGVDIQIGKVLWRWNDIYQAPTEKMNIYYFHCNNSLFTYQVGSRSYCINLDNGSTYWKIRRSESFDSEITGLGDTYYVLGPATDTLTEYENQVGYQGNINTGEIHQFLIPYFSGEYLGPGNFLGAITNLAPFIDGMDTLFVVTYAEASEGNPNYVVSSYLGLYNDTQHKWVYDRILLTEPKWYTSVFHPPIIYEDLLLIQVGKGIVCHDLKTGVHLWSNEDFPQDFLFSGMIVEDGVVYANNEDGYLYALDARYGTLLWKEKTAGTSSRLRYLNGVVYLSGGSTGRIHAVDTETGKTVWLLDPTKYDDGSDDFKPDIYAIPGENGDKGRLIIQTHTTAYCVEAYR